MMVTLYISWKSFLLVHNVRRIRNELKSSQLFRNPVISKEVFGKQINNKKLKKKKEGSVTRATTGSNVNRVHTHARATRRSRSGSGRRVIDPRENIVGQYRTVHPPFKCSFLAARPPRVWYIRVHEKPCT